MNKEQELLSEFYHLSNKLKEEASLLDEKPSEDELEMWLESMDDIVADIIVLKNKVKESVDVFND